MTDPYDIFDEPPVRRPAWFVRSDFMFYGFFERADAERVYGRAREVGRLSQIRWDGDRASLVLVKTSTGGFDSASSGMVPGEIP